MSEYSWTIDCDGKQVISYNGIVFLRTENNALVEGCLSKIGELQNQRFERLFRKDRIKPYSEPEIREIQLLHQSD